MTLNELRLALNDRRLAVVAEAIGMSYQALLSFWQGKSKSLKLENYQALVRYLGGK